MVSCPLGWCARASAGRTRPDSHNGAAGTEPEPLSCLILRFPAHEANPGCGRFGIRRREEPEGKLPRSPRADLPGGVGDFPQRGSDDAAVQGVIRAIGQLGGESGLTKASQHRVHISQAGGANSGRRHHQAARPRVALQDLVSRDCAAPDRCLPVGTFRRRLHFLHNQIEGRAVRRDPRRRWEPFFVGLEAGAGPQGNSGSPRRRARTIAGTTRSNGPSARCRLSWARGWSRWWRNKPKLI